MQAAAPEAVDLTKETEATKKLYGLDDEATAKFGANCLLARRLVERGVRSSNVLRQRQRLGCPHRHRRQSLADVPIVGQADRRSAGRSESARICSNDTLVVWGGEFGRTPFNEKGKGRDHNPWGFTMWMAGGGYPRRPRHRADGRDRFARHRGRTHVHDLHATILHALGLNHINLTYLHNGRAERPTIVAGEVVRSLQKPPAA